MHLNPGYKHSKHIRPYLFQVVVQNFKVKNAVGKWESVIGTSCSLPFAHIIPVLLFAVARVLSIT